MKSLVIHVSKCVWNDYNQFAHEQYLAHKKTQADDWSQLVAEKAYSDHWMWAVDVAFDNDNDNEHCVVNFNLHQLLLFATWLQKYAKRKWRRMDYNVPQVNTYGEFLQQKATDAYATLTQWLRNSGEKFDTIVRLLKTTKDVDSIASRLRMRHTRINVDDMLSICAFFDDVWLQSAMKRAAAERL